MINWENGRRRSYSSDGKPGCGKEAVLASTSQALTYDGVMYGYPVSAETYALYYNKDLIPAEEIPTTWKN